MAQEEPDPDEQLVAQIKELRIEGDYRGAIKAAKQLLELRGSPGDTPAYVIGDAKRLVATLETIAALPDSARAELSKAYRDSGLSWDLFGAEEYDSALTGLEQCIETTARYLGDDHIELAEPSRDLGYFYTQFGEYPSAETPLQRALDIDRAHLEPSHPNIATDLDLLSGVVGALGDYARAQAMLREALAIDKAAFGEESTQYASKLNNLALSLDDAGDYLAAEPLLLKSLALHRRLYGPESEDAAGILNNLGQLLTSKGDYVGAKESLEETLSLYAATVGETHVYYGEALANLADLYQNEGDLDAAKPLYQQALEIFRAYEDDELVASVLNNLADLYHDERTYDLSEPMYRESLDIHRMVFGDDHPAVAAVMTQLARDLRDQGRYAAAESLYDEALGIYRGLFGDRHLQVALCLYSYAACIEATGDFERAVPLLREAVSIYEVARQRAGRGLARTTFQRSPYPLLANALLEFGRTDEAWPAAEGQMARVLAELLILSNSRPLDAAEAATEDSLKSELTRLEQDVAAYRQAAAREGSEEYAQLAQASRDALLETEGRWNTFENELAKKYSVSEGRPYALERVQAAIPAHTALVGWLDVEVRKDEYTSWVYAIRSKGPVAWARIGRQEGAGGDPIGAAAAFRAELAQPTSSAIGVRSDARAVWDARFAPIAKQLDGVDDLVVIPSGALLGVPIDAVVDADGRFLGDRFSVSYAPSATLYAWLREQARGSSEGGDVLIVGDPPFAQEHVAQMEREAKGEEPLELTAAEMPDEATLRDHMRSALSGNAKALASLPRLRGARAEVQAIASYYDRVTALVGVDASEQRLAAMADADSLRRFGVIHLATHALVDDRRPEQSALVLSQVGLPDPIAAASTGERIRDGLVTAQEVVREWHLDADLVTLSACETGLGKRVTGEGYIGLAQAFLQAGSRSVVVSLWKVDDRTSSMLMQRFYANLTGRGADRKPMAKSAALTEAKRWLRDQADAQGHKPFQHPYFWSAFVLVGDRG